MIVSEVLGIFLALYIPKTSAQNDWRTLLTMNLNSPFTVQEIWELNGPVTTTTHSRTMLIDHLNVTKPIKISIEVRDIHWRTMANMVFRSTGILNDIESELLTGQNLLSYRLNKLERFDSYVTDDRFELREPGFQDGMVYFATGRYNITDNSQFIGIPKLKSTFSVSDGIDLREGSQQLWTSYYDHIDGVTNTSIPASSIDNRHIYINGISIYNLDDTTTLFTIGVNKEAETLCDITKMKDLSHKYSFPCNGDFRNLQSSIKMNCLWIFFSTVVYRYNITLWESDKPFVLGHWVQIVGLYDDTTTTTPIGGATYANANPPTNGATFTHSHTISTTTATATTTTTEPYTSLITPLPSSSTTTSDCKAYCNCSESTNYGTSNKTMEEIEDEIQKIKDALTIDRSVLSSTIRRKTSAADDRVSSAGIGVVGVTILVLEIVILLAADLMKFKMILGQSYLLKYLAPSDHTNK